MSLKNRLSALLILVSVGVQAQNNVLSLVDLKSKAIVRNKTIKKSEWEIESAIAASKSAHANAYPTIEGSAMGIHLGKPLGGGMGGMIPANMLNVGLAISQPIYAGGKINNGRLAASKAVGLYEEQKNMAVADVLFNTEKAYWQVVQVKEKIVLAQKYETMLQALEKDLKNSYDAGLIYKNDLLRVQVSLNEAALGVDKAKDGLVLAKMQLAQLAGLGDSEFEIADSVSTGGVVPGDLSLELVYADRPEIRLMNKSLEVSELQQKIIRGDLLPTVALAGNGFGVLGKGINMEDQSNTMVSYIGLLSVSVPIYDWGKTSNKIKEQAYKIAAQREELNNTKELIGLEVANALTSLRQSEKKIRVAELSLKQSDENLKLAADRLKAGTIVGKDVQEAQAIWQDTYSQLIDSKIEYRVNQAAYRKAIGKTE